jgi:hypothetical protein
MLQRHTNQELTGNSAGPVLYVDPTPDLQFSATLHQTDRQVIHCENLTETVSMIDRGDVPTLIMAWKPESLQGARVVADSENKAGKVIVLTANAFERAKAAEFCKCYFPRSEHEFQPAPDGNMTAGEARRMINRRQASPLPQPISRKASTLKETGAKRIEFDVFISAEHTDYPAAEALYSSLTGRGYRVFFAPKLLPKLGNAEYSLEIMRVLDVSQHFALVASSVENMTSSWVQKEWNWFKSAQASGDKDGNFLIVATGNISPRNLPAGLRYGQMVRFNEQAFEDITHFFWRKTED